MAITWQYQQMLDLVEAYYGSGSDEWRKLFTYEVSGKDMANILRQVPGVQVLETESGQYAGWQLVSQESYGAVSNVGSLVNSNTVGGSASVQTSGLIQVPGQFAESAGNVTVKSGAVSTGAKALQFVSGTVLPATIAVATGLKLGYTIDKALYELNPDIFTYLGAKDWNPDVMNDISLVYREEGLPLQEKLWNGLWGINQEDNTTQLYAEETQFAYMAGYLQSLGLFSDGSPTFPEYVSGEKIFYPGTSLESVVGAIKPYCSSLNPSFDSSVYQELATKYSIDLSKPFVVEFDDVGPTATYSRYVLYYQDSNVLDNYTIEQVPEAIPTTKAYYKAMPNNINRGVYKTITKTGVVSYGTYPYGRDNAVTIAYQNVYDGISYKPFLSSFSSPTFTPTLEGTGKQSDAIYPTVPNTNNISDIISALKQQYPELWDSAITNDVLQPDGSIKTFTYLPLPTPTSNSKYDTQPTGDGSEQNQKDTDVKPDSSTQIKDSTTTTIVSPPATPNPPDTGGGDSPTVVPPVGKASSLWSIYNPTLKQVNQFGSWLWSSNFVEQLKKLFNDPMQAIIGLHKVYSPVQTSGQGTIKCGYLDSQVPSKLVSEQYVTVDCGSVDMQEYFGNVFDYPPYTEVSIYLPFIGIRQLDPSDVMRSTISVKYHIDVLTGACLAEVNVQRDASGGTLYTFSGDAAVRYPVSSGSYMGIVSGLIGVATSVVSGNMLPALSGVTRLHTNVDHSGSFTGNAGAMGSKIPYLIISRPQTAMADKFETLSGYPSNTYTPLSACTGFTQVKFCHVENLTATDSEKQEIEQLLKEGVIL